MTEELTVIMPCKCGKSYKPDCYPSSETSGPRFSMVCLKCKIVLVNNIEELIAQWNRLVTDD